MSFTQLFPFLIAIVSSVLTSIGAYAVNRILDRKKSKERFLKECINLIIEHRVLKKRLLKVTEHMAVKNLKEVAILEGKINTFLYAPDIESFINSAQRKLLVLAVDENGETELPEDKENLNPTELQLVCFRALMKEKKELKKLLEKRKLTHLIY